MSINEDLLVYQDEATGKQYTWNGSQYVEYNQSNNDQSSGSQSSGSGDNEKQDNNKQQKSSSSKGNKKSDKNDNKKPQIGDRGSDEIRDKEEIERAEQAAAEGEKPETEDEFKARMKKLRDLKNSGVGDQLGDESRSVADKAETAKERAEAERQAKRFKESPLYKFKISLDGFIKRQTSDIRTYSWSKMNRTHAGGDILRKGAGMVPTGKIPVLNVYFDRSGSWDESKLKYGRSAINTLNKYQKEGKLKIKVYYFSDEIFSDYDDPRAEMGTYGIPIAEHIQKTKPDNVVIMTDDDIDRTDGSQLPDITVPGAVWYLFKDGECQSLPEHIKGKQLTREFEM